MLRKPIIIVVALLASVVFIFLFILPKKDALNLLENKISEKNQELKTREDYFKEIENVSHDLENYQSQLAKIKLAMPEGPQTLVFYDFLHKATSRAGLVLKSISHSEGSGIITFSLGVAGTMDGFLDFLSILEKSARMINIESFSFASPEKERDVINFNLGIKAHFIK